MKVMLATATFATIFLGEKLAAQERTFNENVVFNFAIVQFAAQQCDLSFNGDWVSLQVLQFGHIHYEMEGQLYSNLVQQAQEEQRSVLAAIEGERGLGSYCRLAPQTIEQMMSFDIFF